MTAQFTFDVLPNGDVVFRLGEGCIQTRARRSSMRCSRAMQVEWPSSQSSSFSICFCKRRTFAVCERNTRSSPVRYRAAFGCIARRMVPCDGRSLPRDEHATG